jgi:hypothetical protein
MLLFADAALRPLGETLALHLRGCSSSRLPPFDRSAKPSRSIFADARLRGWSARL